MSHPALDPIALTIDLCAIDSTSGREGEAIAFAERLLGGRGWTTTRIPVTAGRDALLATSGGPGPFVTFSTHLDTVPPYIAPRLDGGRLYGRGTCDAKGLAAAMTCAAERLRDRIPVALLFVVGEETTHDGATAANAWAAQTGFRSKALVNGEPTESHLALGTKGAMRFTLRVEGRACHSAYPHLGVSATMNLVRLLAELDGLALPSDPVLGETTVNVGSITGGVADNVVAPRAEARLMARLVTPASVLQEQVLAWVGDRATVTWGETVPAVHLAATEGLPTAVMAYATDVPVLTNWGRPFLYGPGSIHVAHTDEEHIDVAELRASVDAYERIALGA